MSHDESLPIGGKLELYRQVLTAISMSRVEWCQIMTTTNKRKQVKKLKHKGVSPSDIFFINAAKCALGIDNLQLTAKIFLSQKNDFWYDQSGNPREEFAEQLTAVDGLEYEARVYHLILEQIIETGLSPNFIQLAGLGTCLIKKSDDIYNLFKQLDTRRAKPKELYFTMVVTGSPPDQFLLLRDKFDRTFDLEDHWNKDDVNAIMFQLIYSMAVMQKFGIVHNDLHPSNILVAQLDEPITLTFYINNTYYQFTTQYVPYYFDWDLAYATPLGANPKIETFTDINIKNTFSQRLDMYTLFCYLYNYYHIDEIYDLGGMFDQLALIKDVEEREIKIRISKKEHDNILQFKPLVHGFYRMGSAQMIDIAPQAWKRILSANKKQHINSIAFTLDKQGSYYYLIFNRGYDCHVQHYSDIPTPEEFIALNSTADTQFSQYIVDSKQTQQSIHIYNCPTNANVPYRYFSEVQSTRDQIVGKPFKASRPKIGAKVKTI